MVSMRLNTTQASVATLTAATAFLEEHLKPDEIIEVNQDGVEFTLTATEKKWYQMLADIFCFWRNREAERANLLLPVMRSLESIEEGLLSNQNLNNEALPGKIKTIATTILLKMDSGTQSYKEAFTIYTRAVQLDTPKTVEKLVNAAEAAKEIVDKAQNTAKKIISEAERKAQAEQELKSSQNEDLLRQMKWSVTIKSDTPYKSRVSLSKEIPFDCHVKTSDGEKIDLHRFKLAEYAPALLTFYKHLEGVKPQESTSTSKSSQVKSLDDEEEADAPGTIELDYPAETVQLYVDWIYERKLNLNELSINQVLSLVSLADYLVDEDLKKLCTDKIKNQILNEPRLLIEACCIVIDPDRAFLITEDLKNMLIEKALILILLGELDKPLSEKLYSACEKRAKREVEKPSSDNLFKILWSIQQDDKSTLFSLREDLEKNKKNAIEQYSIYHFICGMCYELGIGTAKNPESAFKCYQQSAAQGNSYGQRNLAWCYEHGVGVGKNSESAFKYYQQSAAQGNSIGQNDLGRCYELGIGTAKNPESAFKFYQQSAAQGNSLAQNNLGVYYEAGIGTAKNPKSAFEWYLKSAEQGNSHGQNNLGRCYELGVGVAKDPKLSFECYRKSAEQGNQKGQRFLAECYHEGFGTPANRENAIHWYLQAAGGKEGFDKTRSLEKLRELHVIS